MKILLLNNRRLIFAISLILTMLSTAFSQTIVYPGNGSETELFAAKEVRRYLYLRTDQKLPVVEVTSLPTSGDVILVANESNAMVQSLSTQINQAITPGGIIIKSISDNGRTVLVITGSNSESTLIAAYRFAEHLGCGFDFSGDAIPDVKIPLSITGFDEAGVRRFETAGYLPFHDFLPGPDLFSTEDYMVLINQLAKNGMNFIGLHNYPEFGLQEEVAQQKYQGAEPNVWIGLEEDINPDGTVKWGFPAYYRHSHSPKRIWGTVEWNTGNYYSGSHELFPSNFWGSDVFGNTAMPTTDAGYADVFNNVGNMFKKSFGFAKEIGVKTALGTELPLGVEPAGGLEVPETWVRGMPLDLQNRLQTVYGKDIFSPQTTRDVYRGMFKRIQKMHDLDYFWLFTYEVWQNTDDVTSEQIQAIKDDIDIARQELNSLGNPFQLALGGWKAGSFLNTVEFDNPLASPYLPYDVPQYVLWDMCEGCDALSPDRVKWAATWTEEDWGLIQPQINVGRVYDDINAAVLKGAKGFIAKGWRNRAVAMNTHAMKYGLWAYGPTGSPVNTTFPSSYRTWTDEVYMDWATRWFGAEVAQGLTNILSPMDKGGEPRQPKICDWGTDEEDVNSAGSVILDQSYRKNDFSFVDDIVALEPLVVGKGNKERFSYLMKMYQSYKEKAEFGTDKVDWNRTNMIGHFNNFMTLDMERAVDVVDLGEIMHNNVMNWHQMVDLFGITGDETPSQNYTGSAFVKVMPVRTQVKADEALTLNILSMPVGGPAPVVKYRELGGSTWTSITATNVGRQVFSATIPVQAQDFEYYVESGSEVFPVTATSSSPIYQTVVVRALPVVGAQYTLTTTAVNGNVTPSGGTYSEGTVVTLTATPDVGYEFSSWSGDLTGSNNPETITMDADKNVTANFVPVQTYTLTTSVIGSGSIDPPGGTYNEGTVVTLTANPDANWQFDSWSGDLTGSNNPETITMDANKNVTATFSEVSAGTWTKVDDSDPPVTYTGSWNTATYGVGEYKGTLHKTSERNAKASFTFNGTKVRYYAVTGASNAGRVKVIIDGTEVAALSLGGTLSGDVMVFESNTLTSGTHTIEIVRGNKTINVDAFEYYGSALKNSTNLDPGFTATTPEVFIYPNPVVDNAVNIRFQGVEDEVKLKLIDLSGKVIINKIIEIQDNGLINLSLKGVSKGIYILSVQSEGVNKNERLIIE